MKRHCTLAFTVLTASALFYGCSPENAPKPPPIETHANNLRIPSTTDPTSLDPRLVRDLVSINVMHMLYEGLMRTGPDGKPEPALAESVSISPDQLTYIFTLRESKWSDGKPVTAEDFSETWKSMLTPDFPAPYAFQLFPIKGAKDAKEGKQSLDKVGISATSPTTLLVQLEEPVPYFLELLTSHFFLPANAQIRDNTDKDLLTHPQRLINNGPFKIVHWKQRNEFVTVKNPEYWDAQSVKMQGVTLQILDENTALQLFKTGDLDLAGSPLSTLPQDAVLSFKQAGTLKISPAAGTHWLRFNTQKAPFDNVKMRKAFNLALNRQAIVEHITQGNQPPARGAIPPSFGFENQKYYKDHDTIAAQKNYLGGLVALKEAGQKLPEISLCYAANDRNHKVAQAIQQQWKKAFGIDVLLESSELQLLYQKLHDGNFQISLGSWYADIRDPINFLEIFKSKSYATNNTYWEDQRFAELLNESAHESSPEKRLELLTKAEEILMDGMPIAPIFHGAFNYLLQDNIEGIKPNELGHLNFKEASFKTEGS